MSGDRRFEWDEAKRLVTLEKHRIDFIDAVEVFYGRPLIVQSRPGDEPRWLAIGTLRGVAVTVVYTIRGTATRIITARIARRNERKWLEDHARDN